MRYSIESDGRHASRVRPGSRTTDPFDIIRDLAFEHIGDVIDGDNAEDAVCRYRPPEGQQVVIGQDSGASSYRGGLYRNRRGNMRSLTRVSGGVKHQPVEREHPEQMILRSTT